MIKSFRDTKEISRFLRLNRSSRSGRMSPPKSASAPFMREPKHSNPMLVGGPVAANPAGSQMKTCYSGGSYPASAKQPANLATHFSHTALALSVSAAALSLSLASGAQAQQTIPAECTVSSSPLAAGGTLTCVVAAPSEVGPIVTTITGITIIIGSDITPTTVRNASGPAISSTLASSNSGGLTIDTTNASVIGSGEGIKVESPAAGGANSGTIRITTADVTGENGRGISLVSGGTAVRSLIINSSVGAVEGTDGIYVQTFTGRESTEITTGDVTGNVGDGIRVVVTRALLAVGVTTINSMAGTVTGARHGIYATRRSRDATSITAAAVTGTTGDGIYAQLTSNSGGTSGALSVTASGAVMGGNRGIFATHAGTGAVTINAAAVTAMNAAGIHAEISNSGSGGNISVTASGAVSGGSDGILATHAGSGSTTVNASMVGAIGGTGEEDAGIRVMSTGTGAISVSNAGSGGTGSRAIIITSTGAVSGAATGISATHSGDGAVSITASNSVTATAGGAISATTTGGDISISGAHTVLGTGGRGIFAESEGGDISIQGVGVTGGVTGAAGNGIQVNARGATAGTGGNIIIGGSGENAIGDVTGTGSGIGDSGISAQTDGADSTITIDSSDGTVMGTAHGIFAQNDGTGASTISISTAIVTGGDSSYGIDARLSNTAATGDISITATGAVQGGRGISVLNTGSGATTIMVDSVSASTEIGIQTRTVAGASVTVNAGGTVSGAAGANAIQTSVPSSDTTSTPADSVTIMGTVSSGNISTGVGADTVTLAAESTTTGITIDLGEGDDTLNLASANFGTLVGGAGADTLALSGTGVDLGGGAHSGFDILAATASAGSNTLSGTHSGFTAANFNGGTTTVTGSLTSTTATVASGATLNLGNISSLAGDLANSGMLTLAGAGIGSATITGDLMLNAGGTVSLNTLTDGSFDQIMVTGAVTVSGTLALGQQTTMPSGTVILIDGASLSGTFATITGLITAPLVSQEITYDTTSGEVRLVTTAMAPASICTVTPDGPLAAGGTLTCISAIPIAETIATTVDGVSIIIGESATPTTVMTASSDAVSATIADTSAAGNISINSAFGTISGGANGIVASTAGSGSITIIGGSVTGNAGDAIIATTAGGDISISGAHTVTGGRGISATSGGGDISIQGVGATGGITGSAGHGIQADARGDSGGNIIIGGSGENAIGDVSGTGSTNDGINAQTNGADSSITIDASGGSVSGGNNGISANNGGTGSISITTAAVTGNAEHGISANLSNDAATGDLSITATGTVIGGNYGINARNAGTGSISITTAAITGNEYYGIFANLSSNTGTGDISIIATSMISANYTGVDVRNAGTGSISIMTASVTGDDAGIIARLGNAAATGDVSVTTTGPITGGRGIDVTNAGTGSISIMSTSATGTGFEGILAQITNSEATSDIEITATGTVMGRMRGISAINQGTGAITIEAAAVTSNSSIYAGLTNSAATGNLEITTTGVVSGRFYGIIARNNGSGTISIDAGIGGANGGENDGNTGISVSSGGTGAISVINAGTGGTGSRTISITSTGAVEGATDGIAATHTGDGAISITSSNSVTATSGNAISATTASGDISISGAHTVLGTGGIGITATSVGGDISIQGVGATGGVTGSAGQGIQADARGGTGGNITIGGTGENAIGDVTGTGTDNSGINALTDGADSSITIDSSGGSVMGDENGIFAYNTGTGESSITITAAVTNGRTASGIYARLSNAAATGDISITATGAIMRSDRGIFVQNLGVGAISITTSDVITDGTVGIYAILGNDNATGDIEITASGAVMGEFRGINASNAGTGAITITTAEVSASAGDAISVTSTGGSAVMISGAHTVTGTGGRGILVVSVGGDVTIQSVGATGGVTGTRQGTASKPIQEAAPAVISSSEAPEKTQSALSPEPARGSPGYMRSPIAQVAVSLSMQAAAPSWEATVASMPAMPEATRAVSLSRLPPSQVWLIAVFMPNSAIREQPEIS